MWKTQNEDSFCVFSIIQLFHCHLLDIVLCFTIELGRSGFYGFVDGGVFYSDEIYTASYLSATLVYTYQGSFFTPFSPHLWKIIWKNSIMKGAKAGHTTSDTNI